MRNIALSNHGQKRMQQRAIKKEWILQTLEFGREQYQKGGTYRYTVGRKEIEKAKNKGLSLDHLLGIRVVCAPSLAAEKVITAYWVRKAHCRLGERR